MKNPVLALKAAFFLLVAGGVWTAAVLYSQNTLQKNGSWIAEKCRSTFALMGSWQSQAHRAMLAGGRLNLQLYHGHQEVLSSEALRLSAVEWRFQIPENSYLDLIFAADEERYSGVRLSTHAEFPSVFFKSDGEGRFLETREIPQKLDEETWHDARLTQDPEALVLKIDGREAARFSGAAFGEGKLGFRGGLLGASVEKLVFTDEHGAEKTENFLISGHAARIFCFNLLLMASLAGAFSLISRRRKNFLPSLRALALLGVLWLAFDYLYYSKLESDDGWLEHVAGSLFHDVDIERSREAAFGAWYALASGETMDLTPAFKKNICKKNPNFAKDLVYCPPNPGGKCEYLSLDEKNRIPEPEKNEIRVLYLGGSFTRGTGAFLPEQTFFARANAILNRELFPRKLSSVVYAVLVDAFFDAENSPTKLVIQGTRKHLEGGHFDFAVVTLNADMRTQVLRPFFQYLQERGMKVIFMPQPRNPESPPEDYRGSYLRVQEQVAKMPGVTSLLLDETFSNPEVFRSGALWWDPTHLTAYGQRRAAEALSKTIIKEIKHKYTE